MGYPGAGHICDPSVAETQYLVTTQIEIQDSVEYLDTPMMLLQIGVRDIEVRCGIGTGYRILREISRTHSQCLLVALHDSCDIR